MLLALKLMQRIPSIKALLFEEQIELVKAREELKKIKNNLFEEVWGGFK